MNENKWVEKLKDRLRIEKDRMDRSGVYGLTQRTLAYNSNKIEGSTLTEKQTASIFETGTLVGEDIVFRTKDVEEMTGHFSMFNYMLETYGLPLTEKLIKEYHYKLKAGVFEDIANGYPMGEYKNRVNFVSDITTALPEDVPDAMKSLLLSYENNPSKSLMDIVKFHADFENIHPFQDGNGRVGRVIIYKECLRNNITPAIIEDNRKGEYYHVLNIAQHKKEYAKLYGFIQDEQKIYSEKVNGFLFEDFSRMEKGIQEKKKKKHMEIDF